jgi:hypothetical protein
MNVQDWMCGYPASSRALSAILERLGEVDTVLDRSKLEKTSIKSVRCII